MSHPVIGHDYSEITLESTCEKCGGNKNLELDEIGHLICLACLDEEEDEEEDFNS